ncbi:hypothetical protein [Streptomyces peucetius]
MAVFAALLRDRSWQQVLAAATHAGVKAAVDRRGATTVHRLTGTWPG